MKFDLPLLIQFPYIKGSTIYVTDNWSGTFSTALGKKQDRDTYTLTSPGARSLQITSTEFGKDG